MPTIINRPSNKAPVAESWPIGETRLLTYNPTSLDRNRLYLDGGVCLSRKVAHFITSAEYPEFFSKRDKMAAFNNSFTLINKENISSADLDFKNFIDTGYFDTANEVMLSAVGNTIRRSVNEGATWTTVASGLTAPITGFCKTSNGYIAFTSSYNGAAWEFVEGVEYAHGTSVVYRSTDNGITWNELTSHTYFDMITTIANTTSDEVRYLNGAILLCRQYGILKSVDDGATWYQVITPARVLRAAPSYHFYEMANDVLVFITRVVTDPVTTTYKCYYLNGDFITRGGATLTDLQTEYARHLDQTFAFFQEGNWYIPALFDEEVDTAYTGGDISRNDQVILNKPPTRRLRNMYKSATSIPADFTLNDHLYYLTLYTDEYGGNDWLVHTESYSTKEYPLDDYKRSKALGYQIANKMFYEPPYKHIYETGHYPLYRDKVTESINFSFWASPKRVTNRYYYFPKGSDYARVPKQLEFALDMNELYYNSGNAQGITQYFTRVK